MKFSLSFSPCPNDTFIFDALVNGKIDTEGFSFDYSIEDIEKLNQHAFEKKYDITKISYHAFLYLTDFYKLLYSGSALGNGVGPLFISKTIKTIKELSEGLVLIPGRYTMANLLLSLAFPEVLNKKEILFSSIEDELLNNTATAGVIIHENRFTYLSKGLKKISDLGEYWEKLTYLPIPLGGIIINKDISPELQIAINRLIRKSIEFAFYNPDSSKSFVQKYASGMNYEIQQKHIRLYVNNFSLDLGDRGKKAVMSLFELALEKKLITKIPEDIFIGRE